MPEQGNNEGMKRVSPEEAASFLQGQATGFNVVNPPQPEGGDPAQEEPTKEPQQTGEPDKEPEGGAAQEPTGGDEPQKVEEPTKDSTADGEPAEDKQTSFDLISEFNKKFSTDYKDEDSIKSVLEGTQRIGELEEQVKELESLKEENLLLKENLDPLKYFASEDDFRAAQFKKQFPDKDASVAQRLFSSDVDLSQISDKDALKYEAMLDTGISESEADTILNEDYRLDEEEPDKYAQAKLRRDGIRAKKNLQSLKSQVKLPDKVDVDSLASQQKELQTQKLEQSKQQWDQATKEIMKDFPDVVAKATDAEGNEKEIFRYEVGQDDISPEVVNDMVNYMAQSGVEVNEQSLGSLKDAVHKDLVSRNLDKIVDLAVKDALARADEERMTKQNNPGSPKHDGDPSKKGAAKDVNETILSAIRSKGPGTPNFLNKR